MEMEPSSLIKTDWTGGASMQATNEIPKASRANPALLFIPILLSVLEERTDSGDLFIMPYSLAHLARVVTRGGGGLWRPDRDRRRGRR